MMITITGKDAAQQVQDWLRDRGDEVTSTHCGMSSSAGSMSLHPLYSMEPGETILSDSEDWSIHMVTTRKITICSASEAGKRRVYWGDGVLDDLVFAERLLLELDPECYGVNLQRDEHGAVMLNDARVPDGHAFGVLDVDGDTLATGETRAEAIESACRREIKALEDRVSKLEARWIRVTAATRTLREEFLD